MPASLTRREALQTMALGTAALAAGSLSRAARSQEAAGRRPNVLFLFTDDQRFDTLHALGNTAIRTPNMDRLVERGVAFTHCYIMGSTVPAVCICSRASLITGRHLYAAPQVPQAQDGLAFWPQVFRDHGYATFETGKWHNGPWSLSQSFTGGESIFFGGMSDHLKVPVSDFDPSGKYPAEDRQIGKCFSSELFSDSAVEFLRQYEGEAPWFAYVSYTAPHDPRMAPKEFADLYRAEGIELPPNFLPEHRFDNGELRIRDELLAPFPRTPEVIREHVAAYYAMITHVDHHIGRVLDALDERGETDNTIILFGGDNGLAVGQHGLMGKQNMYEHSMRVPLVMCGPGIPQRERRDELVYLHDLMPTTCELAGLETPETVQSRSLAPLLRGEPGGYESVFGAYMDVQRMVRQGQWKLIRYPYAEVTQLFDLGSDPWEMRNLAADPQHADRIEELTEELHEWQKVTEDRLDLDSPPPRPGAGQPVRPSADGVLVLAPENAKTTGALRYQADRNNLGAWTNPRDFAEWKLTHVKAGEYAVEFGYGCTNPGVEYTIAAGEAKLSGTTEHTGGLKVYTYHRVGRLSLPDGSVTLRIQPGDFHQGAFMNFRLLTLTPVE